MLRVENICKTFFAGTINEKKALQGLSPVERSLLTVMILQKRRNINGPNILGVSSRIR